MADYKQKEDSNTSEFGKVSDKKAMPVITYVELHSIILSVVEVLEEVFELGRMKGREDYVAFMSTILKARAEDQNQIPPAANM